ncbi:hypothetical protein GC105_16215 [Alkalibaculum sp. M08DMB]|uniref:GCVT N-terminal domain-containing protein n=1 Tax=Alkalibaculum sporogenes TaxID=2655001 RepID=A0A6A7KD97_9FIRM|nr:aminomethyltransferase family protein [Alkalibaculum sporogenes]MPW27311.1 hypothetical protein [Alkalibaculum sporogenes]
MKVFEKINGEEMRKTWAERFDSEKSIYGGKSMAFSPAVQAQTSPYGQLAIGEMPTYAQLHSVLIPYEYTGWMDETNSISTTGYIGDWSWLEKIRISGPDVVACLEASTINSYKNLPVGKAKHIVSITPDGKMIGDGIAFREGENQFLLTAGLTMADGQMLKLDGFDIKAETVTSEIYNFHVQGPVSKKVIEKVCDENIDDLGFIRFKDITIAGRKVRLYRGGMSGEIGYELFGDAEDGSFIWKQIVEAGKEFGLRQLGFRSMIVNHLQAFFPTIWIDFMPSNLPKEAQAQTLYRSPVDFGWGNLIDKTRDFPGKDILLKEMESPTHISRTLEWNNEDCISIVASLFDTDQEPLEQMAMPVNTSEMSNGQPPVLPILNKDQQFIGFASNRGYSIQFRKFLSIAYLDINYADLEEEVYVVYGSEGKRQTMIRATVAEVPYKKDNRN